MPRNTNSTVIPGVSNALDQMKFEVANELGFTNYEQIDKGSLPSRVNGYVGGNITKRLVALGQAALANNTEAAINATSQVNLETPIG
ncbi:MAG: alpha/beta-type small acid-soluble spore protein [Peptococcaceae bacterium]|nr:alpha/beta-type small acid-soluble spore protein [Candidatus Syntrophopropionicum ammoniitolerans]